MPKNLRKKIVATGISMLLLLVGPAAGTAYAKSWEPVKTEPTNLKSIAKDTDVEIKASPGTIIIISAKGDRVKVFTILGQLVSDETIPAGMSRFQINAHGVYIIKVGDLTCKVAL